MFRTLLLVTLVAACGGNDQNGKTNPQGDGGGSNTPDAYVDPSCATPGVFPTLKQQLVVPKTALTKPVFLAQPSGSTDLFVVEEGGTVRIVRGGAVLPTPFLTIADTQLPNNGEGGLLSIAFHKDYATNGRFFTYGTVTANNQAVVREYKRSTSNPDVADPTPVAQLVSQPNDGNANVGGTIAFGNDGLLYVSAGDGGDAPEAQDLTSRRGKILRVDIDSPGTAPAGNMPGGDPYVWDSGLRNVYRMTFDRKTHELYLADAGDAKFEEVNIEQPGAGHKNYGWDVMEGKVCNNPATGCDMTGITLPQYVRPHQVDFSVIIGGSVYRGPAIPCLSGYYLYAIYGTTSHVLAWQWDGTNVSPEKDISDVFPDAMDPVAINEDAAGELYLVTLSNGIYKLLPG